MTGPFLDPTLIRSARLDAQLTERGLARLLGVDALRVRRWEAGLGHATITLATLHALSATIGVTPAALIQSGPEPGTQPSKASSDRKLTLTEARVLHTALTGELRLVARGTRGISIRTLINDYTLVLRRDDPTQASEITVSTDIVDTIHPPVANRSAERQCPMVQSLEMTPQHERDEQGA